MPSLSVTSTDQTLDLEDGPDTDLNTLIIPNNSTYYVTGTAVFTKWVELR